MARFGSFVLFVELLSCLACSLVSGPTTTEIALQSSKLVSPSSAGNKILVKRKAGDISILSLIDFGDGESVSIDESRFTQLSLTWHSSDTIIFFQKRINASGPFHIFQLNLKSRQAKEVKIPPSSTAIPSIVFSGSGELMAFVSSRGRSVLYIYDISIDSILVKIPGADPYSKYSFSGDTALIFFRNPDVPTIEEFDIIHQERNKFHLESIEKLSDIQTSSCGEIYIVGRRNRDEFFSIWKLGGNKNDRTRLLRISPDIEHDVSRVHLVDTSLWFNVNVNGVEVLMSKGIDDFGLMWNLDGSVIPYHTQSGTLLHYYPKTEPSMLLKIIDGTKLDTVYRIPEAENLKMRAPETIRVKNEVAGRAV